MAIEFYLLSRDRDTLRKKLPRKSPALKSLDQAAPIEFSGRHTREPEWAVTCDEHDARVI